MNGYIYIIANDVNEKVYIGQTIYPIEKRFKQHVRDRKKRAVEKRPLYRAMNKYGVEHFYINLIEECSLEKQDERESYWIEYFDSYRRGYNATKGGDGKNKVDYEVIIELFMDGKNIKEIASIQKCDTRTVRIVLHSKYGVTKNETWSRGHEKRRKPVLQIDMRTGAVIAEYESAYAAQEALGIGHGHVGAVCNGKRKGAGGFYWKWKQPEGSN